MTKKTVALPFLLVCAYWSSGQAYHGIGYTGAWLNSSANASGGLAYIFGRNIIETPNSAISVSTNLKLGMEDKIGTGIIIPGLVVLGALGADGSNVNTNNISGGKIHLFTDIPLLLHYNWGLGSNNFTDKQFGFYLGGGMSYTTTGFTDTAGFSKGTAFFGYVFDAGIRFAKNADLNFSMATSLRQPVGPMLKPVFFEITLSVFFRDR